MIILQLDASPAGDELLDRPCVEEYGSQSFQNFFEDPRPSYEALRRHYYPSILISYQVWVGNGPRSKSVFRLFRLPGEAVVRRFEALLRRAGSLLSISIHSFADPRPGSLSAELSVLLLRLPASVDFVAMFALSSAGTVTSRVGATMCASCPSRPDYEQTDLVSTQCMGMDGRDGK